MSGLTRRAVKSAVPASFRPLLRRLRDEMRLQVRCLPPRLRGAAIHPARHALPAELVVSLTSYPRRFPFVGRTLDCLLRQSVKPDRIVLWIGERDAARLPARLRRLSGVELRTAPELGSYKKLVPALAAFPQAFVATADDDVYYDPDWLRMLVDGYLCGDPAIVCQRAHRPALRADGSIAPYAEWERDVQDAAARRPSDDIVPTGVGGVLYPPGSLDMLASDSALFARLCPTTDDFWFFWMARRAGWRHRKVGPRFRYLDWPGSQESTLHGGNLIAGYDRQVAALAAHFGVPSGLRGPARTNPGNVG